MNHFDKQGEIENNTVDYNEIPSPREGTEFNAKAQRDQFLGGGGKPTEATNVSGTLQEQHGKREQQPITAPKGEVEEFRMKSAWKEAFNRFTEAPGESYEDIYNVTLVHDPEKIFTYLSQNWNNLNEQEKFFLQVTGAKRKYEQGEHPETGETVTLRGDEARKFSVYRDLQEFDEALGKVLESNDPHVDEVMRVTTQSDPEKVAGYISQHQTELPPTLLDFLLRSLRIKTSG